jgi:hypothetical protein
MHISCSRFRVLMKINLWHVAVRVLDFVFGRVLVPVTYLRNFCTTCRHMTFKSLAKSGCVGAEWDRTPIFGEQISLGNEFLIAP